MKEVGGDTFPFHLSKNQWSLDTHTWLGIKFPDIYMHLITTPGKFKNAKPEGKQKPQRLIRLQSCFVLITEIYETVGKKSCSRP